MPPTESLYAVRVGEIRGALLHPVMTVYTGLVVHLDAVVHPQPPPKPLGRLHHGAVTQVGAV